MKEGSSKGTICDFEQKIEDEWKLLMLLSSSSKDDDYKVKNIFFMKASFSKSKWEFSQVLLLRNLTDFYHFFCEFFTFFSNSWLLMIKRSVKKLEGNQILWKFIHCYFKNGIYVYHFMLLCLAYLIFINYDHSLPEPKCSFDHSSNFPSSPISSKGHLSKYWIE